MAKHSRAKSSIKSAKEILRLSNIEGLAYSEILFVKSEMDKQQVLLKEIAELKRINLKLLLLIGKHSSQYKNLLKRHSKFILHYEKMRSIVYRENIK